MRALHGYRLGRLARYSVKNFVAAEAKNVVNARGFLAPLHRLVAAVMAVAAHQDVDLGPMPADALDDMLEDRANFFAGRRLALAQDHRHRLAACCFIDVDRQEAALVIMGVEQRELLMAVHRVAGIVDVKRNRGRRAPIAFTERIHQRRHQSGDLDLRRRILQPRHGGLRAQGITTLRRMAYRHLEDRIVPERIAIVGVLVARCDRKHPQPKHLLKRVHDTLGLAPVPNASCKARRKPELLLDLAQHKDTCIRRQLPAVERDAQFLACNRWKIEGKESIFAHDGCGAPQSIRDSVSQTEP